MREIKFRAWDKCYITTLHKNGKMLNIPLSRLFREYGVNPKRFILMQYTGLKDKNGKEIFEGDIVEISEQGYHCVGDIFYSEEYARFRVRDFYFPHYDDPTDFTDGIRYAKIIGNIYKTPELLEGK